MVRGMLCDIQGEAITKDCFHLALTFLDHWLRGISCHVVRTLEQPRERFVWGRPEPFSPNQAACVSTINPSDSAASAKTLTAASGETSSQKYL